MKRVVRLALFNVVFFLVLCESVGLVRYWLQSREVYYWRSPQAQVPLQQQTVDSSVKHYRLHPFFGFVGRPSRRPEAALAANPTRRNNHGFAEYRHFPYVRRDPNEVIVGLFGGSVAMRLARSEYRNGIIAERLAAALGRPAEAVTVLNFAQGGFKQPQQLLIYTYFHSLGQQLDWVVNIDGFNEIALASSNAYRGVAVAMPSMQHMKGLQDVVGTVSQGQGLERLVAVRQARRRYEGRAARIADGSAWSLRFAVGHLVQQLLLSIDQRRFTAALLEYTDAQEQSQGDPWLFLERRPRARGEDRWQASLPPSVDLWRRASETLHRLQTSGGGRYLHVIQPNQYYRTARQFSAEEKAIAFAEKTPYRSAIERGYPLLAAAVPALRDAGVTIQPAFELFDAVAEPVYVDDCCHYNALGDRLLATAIADSMVSMLKDEAATASR